MSFATRRLWPILLLVVVLQACGREPTQQAEFFVFGTLVDVQLRAAPDEAAQPALQELQVRFQAMHRDWHAWESGELTDLNQALARGEEVRASADLLTLVRRSQALEAASGGLFNPAAGGLVKLWGFHTSDFPVSGPPPSEAEILAWLEQSPSMSDIRIEDDFLSTGNAAVMLDFGAVAKGFAVDIAVELLAARGLGEVMVNAGGDLRARGTAEAPWRVGVSDPAGGVIAAIEVTGDEAVFTSGTSQRYRQHDGARYPHVLDPRTGQAASGLQAATVVTQEGLVADAVATALLVAGPERWPDIARSMNISQALVITDDGQIQVTPTMNQRLEWAPGTETRKTVVTQEFSH